MRILDKLSIRKSRAAKRVEKESDLLRGSPLLDAVWYRQAYLDLRDTPLECSRHYIEHGARERRNPYSSF